MKKSGSILLLLVIGFSAQASLVQEYLTKVNENYRALSSFQLSLEYELYRGPQGEKLMDSYSSVLKHKGNLSHRRLHQEEIITTDENTVVLNHDLRTIQIMPFVEQDIFELDIKKSLKECRDIQLTESKEEKQIILYFNEVSQAPYSVIKVNIDNEFWIKNITYFYAEQMNFSTDYFHPDLDFPRLEVAFGSLKKNWNDEKELTTLSRYAIKNGETYFPATLYQDYEVIVY